MNQIKQQNEEVERIKKEQQTKEKQLQETIGMLETVWLLLLLSGWFVVIKKAGCFYQWVILKEHIN